MLSGHELSSISFTGRLPKKKVVRISLRICLPRIFLRYYLVCELAWTVKIWQSQVKLVSGSLIAKYRFDEKRTNIASKYRLCLFTINISKLLLKVGINKMILVPRVAMSESSNEWSCINWIALADNVKVVTSSDEKD